MKKYNSTLSIFMIQVILTLSSCMQFKYTFVSPGRVDKKSYSSHNTNFNVISDSISGQHQSNYEVIGHGVSSWRYYPMGVSKKGFVYGNNQTNVKEISVTKLITNSYQLDSTLSIELDAQYVPIDDTIRKIIKHQGAYVMHDIPKWGSKKMIAPEVFAYLKNNTLKSAVDHFTNMGYYQYSKMYIEIKVSKTNFKECDAQCKELAQELNDYAKKFVRGNNQNWLCITSFSPYALEKFRNFLSQEAIDKFDYVLIAGYTFGWPKSSFAQLKGYVPKFDESISNFAIHSKWLTCIWFSSQGIKDFKKQFLYVNEERSKHHPEWNKLKFSFSTYPMKTDNMNKSLLKNSNKKIPIQSYMLDFDDIKQD